MSAVEPIIARTLGIQVDQITDDLGYQVIPEWDSLRHVGLMVALEATLGTRIDDDLTIQLTSVKAIREFAQQLAGSSAHPTAPAAVASAPQPAGITIHRGLEGVYVDRTTVTHIDGKQGNLIHRGYNIHELVERSSFEEMSWLLINGDLPDAKALRAFDAELRANRQLPSTVVDLTRALAKAHPMEVLRTCVSALGALESDGRDESTEHAMRAGVRLIAQITTLIATYHAFRSGREPLAPRSDLSHAANFHYMLFGKEASPGAAQFIDMDLIVHADHGANASAFTARVATSCRSNLTASITAGIAAFAGSLHGGAAERVMDLIDAVGSPDNAEKYVRHCFDHNQPVMGFGHRVYKTEDPRVVHLRKAAKELAVERGDLRGISIIEAVVEAMKPYARHGVGANVDLYAGLAYRLLGIPDDLAVPMFVAGRMSGWVAQVLEQKSNNVLIRPLLQYVGPLGRTYRPVETR